LDTGDVSLVVLALTLDCGVAADGLGVTLVNLGGGETGCSEFGGFHVCIISGLEHRAKYG
jgi:hypothetical protein